MDRVDYFRGITYVTNECNGLGADRGLSLGNFINLSIDDEINGDFTTRLIGDPLFMHEFGHIFQSMIYGLLYLPLIEIPSAISFQTIRNIDGFDSHDLRWYEKDAHRWAARYFEKHYRVN